MGKEEFLRALFKINDDELTFHKAVEVAAETEDAGKAAKKTVHGSMPTPILKMSQKKAPTEHKGTAGSSLPFP